MTYRCGIGARMARVMGVESGPAQVTCDKCGRVELGQTSRGHMAAWLRLGTTPRGWRKEMREDLTSLDYCPKCK